VDPQEPDFVILMAAAYRAMTERLDAELLARGIEGMRPSYGYVIRAVHAEQPTVNRLAALLDVTKQTASKLADDMIRGGFLERRPDPDDRRRVRLGLSERGEAVRRSALETSRKLERELAQAAGAGTVPAAREAMMALVERHGGLADVMARRPKPPR
jgi:DNA-binding MarR family transcriptional regulator